MFKLYASTHAEQLPIFAHPYGLCDNDAHVKIETHERVEYIPQIRILYLREQIRVL